MQRFRSFRESFRRKKDKITGCNHNSNTNQGPVNQWHTDEISVRQGNCAFPVKYLGCVEVFESRGMPICEEALKVLRGTKRKSIRGTLFVSGDGLRIVDCETRGLIVDQTIEKVSFCAPDRNNERGFAYICRDGTTRRWMCHGFHAIGNTGERLSHAVGCAFAICLERKQKRDREALNAQHNNLTQQIRESQPRSDNIFRPVEPPPMKPVINPNAIDRPHATPLMLQRQISFRTLSHLRSQTPFKRQLSLKLQQFERAAALAGTEQQQISTALTSPNPNLSDGRQQLSFPTGSDGSSSLTKESNTDSTETHSPI